MQRRRSTFVDAVVLALGAQLAGERAASAQACCVAPSTTGLGRLADYENALAGVEARGTAGYGSMDAAGHFRASPRGAHDVELEQNLFVTGRWLKRGQATLTVPFVETLRGANGTSAAGGGLGDVRIGLRWDAVFASSLPGFAVLAGAQLPTGTPPERAKDALGAGATGAGTVQGWGGFAVEQTFGPWLAAFSGTVTVRAPRDVDGTISSLPPRWSVGLVGAYAWMSGFVLSAGASYGYEGNASVAGESVPGTSRRSPTLAIGLQAPLGRRVRLVASAFATPPIDTLSAGDPATAGLSLAAILPWP